MEKTITMSKKEFDDMTEELTALRETVKSKTITTIIRPNYYYYDENCRTIKGGYRLEFVMGSDDNNVVTALTDEITTLKKSDDAKLTLIETMLTEITDLKNSADTWKTLPWYKRLFVK